MMWDNDPWKDEKHLLFDAIMRLTLKYDGKNLLEISLKELHEFIDEYFEQNGTCESCSSTQMSCSCFDN